MGGYLLFYFSHFGLIIKLKCQGERFDECVIIIHGYI